MGCASIAFVSIAFAAVLICWGGGAGLVAASWIGAAIGACFGVVVWRSFMSGWRKGADGERNASRRRFTKTRRQQGRGLALHSDGRRSGLVRLTTRVLDTTSTSGTAKSFFSRVQYLYPYAWGPRHGSRGLHASEEELEKEGSFPNNEFELERLPVRDETLGLRCLGRHFLPSRRISIDDSRLHCSDDGTVYDGRLEDVANSAGSQRQHGPQPQFPNP